MNSGGHGGKKATRFVPRVECLEDRTVPSGNVQALVFDGTLYVAGDDAGNQIQITGTGARSVTVRALDADTTINGRVGPVSFGGITRDLYVRMHGGDDTLIVTGTRNRGTLNADTGDGNDMLGVSGAGHRSATILDTGVGNDTAILHASVFRRFVSLNTGVGDDQVVAASIGAVQFGLTNPSGNDFFDNRGSTLARRAVVGFTAGVQPAPSPPVVPDTVAPTATVTTLAANPTNANPIAFAVTFNEDVTGFDASDLTVTNGTVTAFTATDARTFAVQVTPTAQGDVSVTATAGGATDAALNGNLVSNTVTLTFDSVVPTIVTNPLTTNDTTPTVTGTVSDPTAGVRVTVNGRTYTATVTSGIWTADVIDILLAGTYSITAIATDPAGNVGIAPPANLVVDVTAPLVATFDLATTSDSGTTGDLRTDASMVTLSGTTEVGATVRLFAVTVPGTPGSGTPLMETTAAANGTFSFAGIALAIGPKSFAVRALDALGNVGATFAQTFTRNTAPTVANDIADQTPAASDPNLTFDLATALTGTFADAERVVRFTTTAPTGAAGALQTATIDVNLFATQTPGTVTNFLAYDYDTSVFHRLAPDFVLQGGGFGFNDAGTTTATAFPPITAMAAITNEPGVSNTRGTIAMAKTGGNPNSATKEFFFNLADNSTNLDAQNGGFTVFGQVMNGGQQTLNTINSTLSTLSGLGVDLPGAEPFPVRSGANTASFPANINATDVVLATDVSELEAIDRMVFTASSSSPGVATATVGTGAMSGTLTVDPMTAGMTTITVRATDLDGSFTEITFQVTVTP